MSERRKRPFLGQNAPEDDFYAQFYGPKDNSGDRPIRDEEPKKKAFWAGREAREPRPEKEPRAAREPKPAKEPRAAMVAEPVRTPRRHRAAKPPVDERERGTFVAWVIARRTALGMAAGAAVAVAAGLVIVSGATGAGSGSG